MSEKFELKQYLKVLLMYVCLLGGGFLLGYNGNVISVQRSCNDFIMDNYVNITVSECRDRCQSLEGVVHDPILNVSYFLNQTLVPEWGAS